MPYLSVILASWIADPVKEVMTDVRIKTERIRQRPFHLIFLAGNMNSVHLVRETCSSNARRNHGDLSICSSLYIVWASARHLFLRHFWRLYPHCKSHITIVLANPQQGE
jgi:hypothetical protein